MREPDDVFTTVAAGSASHRGDKNLYLTLLHSERPKLYIILAFLSAIGLKCKGVTPCFPSFS